MKKIWNFMPLPKRRPRGPRGAQEAPKRSPRGAQEDAKRRPRGPRGAQEPKRSPRGAQERPQEPHERPKRRGQTRPNFKSKRFVREWRRRHDETYAFCLQITRSQAPPSSKRAFRARVAKVYKKVPWGARPGPGGAQATK
jgi:hypothetical protein